MLSRHHPCTLTTSSPNIRDSTGLGTGTDASANTWRGYLHKLILCLGFLRRVRVSGGSLVRRSRGMQRYQPHRYYDLVRRTVVDANTVKQ